MLMREWSNLDEGILDLILSKLFDQDRYNFMLVCRSWNAVVSTSPSYPVSPCLIHYNRKKWRFFQYKSFFYRSFPDVWDAEILCSKYGWLLMSEAEKEGDGGYLFFFNPFNGHTKPFVDICWRKKKHKSTHFFHPPTSPNCFIIGVTTDVLGKTRVSILRYGDGESGWKCIYCKNDESEFFVSNSAPVLHRGLLYFVGMRGDVATLDVERCTWSATSRFEPFAWPVYPKSFGFRKLRSQIRQHYLFKINGDEDDSLYVVFMIHESETVNVFRLLEPEMKWERVKDLGDKMLYLSLASSFGEVAKPKNMANTICLPMFDLSGDNLLFYSLKTQRYHSFDGNYSFDDNIYGLSRLDYGVAWIKPIPTQQLSINGVWYSDTEDRGFSYDEDGNEEFDNEEESLLMMEAAMKEAAMAKTVIIKEDGEDEDREFLMEGLLMMEFDEEDDAVNFLLD